MPVTPLWSRGAEKQASKAHGGLRHLFTHIPQINMSRREKHIMRCRSPCKAALSMWQGRVQVCLRVALFIRGMSPDYSAERNCIETERVSPQLSSDTDRPQLVRARLTFTWPGPFTSSVICKGNLSRKKMTCCVLNAGLRARLAGLLLSWSGSRGQIRPLTLHMLEYIC